MKQNRSRSLLRMLENRVSNLEKILMILEQLDATPDVHLHAVAGPQVVCINKRCNV